VTGKLSALIFSLNLWVDQFPASNRGYGIDGFASIAFLDAAQSDSSAQRAGPLSTVDQFFS